MQNVVGPTLVAMATKFGLGAEIHGLPACLSVCLLTYSDQVTSKGHLKVICHMSQNESTQPPVLCVTAELVDQLGGSVV